MKKTLFAALLASAAVIPAAQAAGPVRFTGDLNIGFGGQERTDDFTTNSFRDNSPLYLGIDGSLFIPLDNKKLSVTVDAFAQFGWDAADEPVIRDSDFTNFGLGAHFNYTVAGRYMLGVVGAVQEIEALSDGPQSNESFTVGLIGAEAKFFFDRAAIWAQAGFTTPFDNYEFNGAGSTFAAVFEDVTYFRGGVNYYLEANTKLAATIGVYSGTQSEATGFGTGGFEDPMSLNQYQVEIEQKIGDQWSIYAQGELNDFATCGDFCAMNDYRLTVGFRIRLGDGDTATLQDHEVSNSIGTPDITHLNSISHVLYND
jgi:hypothetical protein